MKNIDGIRALSEKRLAELFNDMLDSNCGKHCPAFKFCNDNGYHSTPCEDVIYDWLTSDVNKKKLKIFISMPMSGKTESELKEIRDKIISACRTRYGNNIEIIDSIIDNPALINKPLACLAEAIKLLADADIAVFDRGWESARGCEIEHACCEKYGIKTAYYTGMSLHLFNVPDTILFESEQLDIGNGNVLKVKDSVVYLSTSKLIK